MATDDVLIIGESLVDVVTTPDGATRSHPGGSAANVAVALARLERPVRFATSWGDDDHGRLLARHLAGAGVRLEGEPRILARTSSAHATIGPDGSATYSFDLEWRLGPIDPGRPRMVHVGSIGAVLAPGAADVERALRSLPPGVLVSYDVNARPAITGDGPHLVAQVERIVGLAQLVKASDEDLAVLYPGLDVAGAAARLLALGPRAVVVTQGAQGATWHDTRGVVAVAAEPVAVVDTIGAGDTVAAALLDALWDAPDRDPAEVLRHAVRAAAVTVSRAGADPPTRRDLRTLD